MFWKLIGLQRILDELFDEEWLRLDLPRTDGWFLEESLEPGPEQ